jgi:hypothetical protein
MRTLKIKPVKNDKGRIVEYEIFENEEYMNTAYNLKKLIKAIKDGMFNDLTVEEAEGTYTVIFYGTIVEGVTDRMTYISDEFSSRKEAFDYIETNNEPYRNHPDYAQAYKSLMEPEFIIEIEGVKTIFTKKKRVITHKETQSTAEFNNEEEEILEPNGSIEYRDGFILRNEDDTYSVMMYEYENVYSYDEASITSAKQLIDYFMEHGV